MLLEVEWSKVEEVVVVLAVIIGDRACFDEKGLAEPAAGWCGFMNVCVVV
jgi:hypothetical protein